MSTSLYVPFETAKDSGFKLVAEVDGTDNPALALDALLDENPKLKHTKYVAIVGSLEEGTTCVLEVDPDAEPVNPRRNITVTGGPAASSSKSTAATSPAATEKAKPATKRAPARKPAAAKKGSTKPAAKRKPATKPAASKAKGSTKPAASKAKGGGSPFKRNAKGDE